MPVDDTALAESLLLEVGVAPTTAKKLAVHGLDLVRRAVANWHTQRREVGGKMENHPGIVIFWLSNLEKAGIPPTLPAAWFESELGAKYGGEQPAPQPTTTYAVDLPGVYRLPAAATPEPAKPLPPPLAHDDPWAVCLSELRNLPGVALDYLADSRLEAAGDVDGVPLYRVVVGERAAMGLSWLTAQAGPAIRRKLGGVLRKPVLIEIVAMEGVSA